MDDDLTARLRALGRQPLPPATSAAHLAAMAAVAGPRPRRRFGRVAVGLAALSGFLVGGSGLAMAGALPGPAQGAAAGVLATVGLDVAPAEAHHGACVRASAQAGDDRVADVAKSGCGKHDRRPTPVTDGDPCTGPPPWARGAARDLDAAALDELKDAHRTACGRDDGDDDRAEDDEAPGGRRGAGGKADDGDPCTGRPPWAGSRRGPTAEERALRDACADVDGAPDDDSDGASPPDPDGDAPRGRDDAPRGGDGAGADGATLDEQPQPTTTVAPPVEEPTTTTAPGTTEGEVTGTTTEATAEPGGEGAGRPPVTADRSGGGGPPTDGAALDG